MASSDALLKSFVAKIGQGKLCDVLPDILKLEITYDTGVTLCSAYVRRLKQLDGGLLPRKEVHAAHKLLSTLIAIGKDKKDYNMFPYFCHIAVIYRQLLIKEKLDLVTLGETLLLIERQWILRDHESHEINLLQNNMYAYAWNYLRDNYNNLDAPTSLLYASQALRWLVRKGEKNFSTASHKIHQISYILQRCQSYEPVERLMRDILNEGKVVWFKESPTPLLWSRNMLQLDGFYNFTICSVRFLMYFEKIEPAKKLFHDIFETFKSLFDPDLVGVAEKVVQLFFDISECFIGQLETRQTFSAESLDITINALKSVEEKSSGIRHLFMYGFLQGISALLQGLKEPVKQRCKTLETKEFEVIISALYKLTSILRNSSPHNDLLHLQSRKREAEATSLNLILRLIADHLNCKKESNSFLKKVAEKIFDQLNRIISSNLKSKDFVIEAYTRMNYHGGQIGTALQRVKDFDGALKILMLSMEAAEKLQDIEKMDVTKVDPTHIAVVVADTYSQMKEFDTGLRFLAEWIFKHPTIMAKVPSCFDVYEPLVWYDWTYHWNLMKRQIAESNCKDLMCKTVIDYLVENKDRNLGLMKNKKELLLRILYFEFNAYFSTRSTIPDGIIGVGEALQNHGNNLVDESVGLFAQGVGFWWGDCSQVISAIGLFRDTLLLLEEEAVNCPGNPVASLLAALTHAWLGFGYLRQFQEISASDLETIKNDDLGKNPNRYAGVDDDQGITRVIPAVSSINMREESQVARHLIKAIDMLYDLMTFADSQKHQLNTWVHKIGPAVVLMTVQFLSRVTYALGDKYAAFKSWCVTNTLSRLYDRKFLFILSSSEMVRLCPSLHSTMCVLVDDVTSAVESRFANRPKGLQLIRMNLANSVAFLALKKYQEGLNFLIQVLQFRTEKDTTADAGYHALGEAYFVLAEYRLLEEPLGLDFSRVPKYLRYLTPAGLVAKGFKTLAGVTRSPNPIMSGWVDLLHNYLVLGTVMNVAENAVKHYYLAGKIREVRCFAADFIFLAQQMGLVSRTIEVVVPLAEMDIQGRSFDSCQQKVDCIIKMLKGFVPSPSPCCTDEELQKSLQKKLKITDSQYKWILEDINVSWRLPPVTLPEHNFGPDGPPPSSMTNSPMITEPRKMKRIMYLHHPINCSCYICRHPSVIPSILRFINLQARLASCSKNMKTSVMVLESANRFHQKAMLRILANYEAMKASLTLYIPPASAAELLDIIYMDFFIKPGLRTLVTKMEMMPAMDVSRNIPALQQIWTGLEHLGYDHMAHKSIPLEILYSAIFRSVFQIPDAKIRKSDVRSLIKDAAKKTHIEFPLAESPPNTEKLVTPQLAPRKGGRRVQTQLDGNLETECQTEHFDHDIRKPTGIKHFNFDDEDEEPEIVELPQITTRRPTTRSRTRPHGSS